MTNDNAMHLTLVDFHGYWDRRKPPARGISCRLVDGDWVSILGDNGTGKSTLVKAIAGLAPFCIGSIDYAGSKLRLRSPLDRFRASFAYVGQDSSFPDDMPFSILHGIYYYRRRSIFNAKAHASLMRNCLEAMQWSEADLEGLPMRIKEFLLGLSISPSVFILDELGPAFKGANIRVCPYQLVKKFCPEAIVFVVDHDRNVALAASKYVAYLGDPMSQTGSRLEIPFFGTVGDLSDEQRASIGGNQTALEKYVKGYSSLKLNTDEPVKPLLRSAVVASTVYDVGRASEIQSGYAKIFPFLADGSLRFGELSGGQKVVVISLIQKLILGEYPPREVLGHLSDETATQLRHVLDGIR